MTGKSINVFNDISTIRRERKIVVYREGSGSEKIDKIRNGLGGFSSVGGFSSSGRI